MTRSIGELKMVQEFVGLKVFEELSYNDFFSDSTGSHEG